MSRQSKIRWALHVPLALAVMVLAHVLTVWAVPRVIMGLIIDVGSGDLLAQNRRERAYLPPPTDHTQRRIVMPSPDLLYATCAYDLDDGPTRVTFDTTYPRYWSIALYASNSDNFFVVNDRDTAGGSVDFTVIDPDAASTTVAAGSVHVRSPTRRGFLLMRILVSDDPAIRAAAEAARRGLRCTL